VNVSRFTICMVVDVSVLSFIYTNIQLLSFSILFGQNLLRSVEYE